MCVLLGTHIFSLTTGWTWGQGAAAASRLSAVGSSIICFLLTISTETKNFTTKRLGIGIGTTCICVCCSNGDPTADPECCIRWIYRQGEKNPLFGEKAKKLCP